MRITYWIKLKAYYIELSISNIDYLFNSVYESPMQPVKQEQEHLLKQAATILSHTTWNSQI